jgi:hypothetical protein
LNTDDDQDNAMPQRGNPLSAANRNPVQRTKSVTGNQRNENQMLLQVDITNIFYGFVL